MKYAFFLSILFSALGCKGEYDVTMLHGKWKTVEWTILPTNETRSQQMDFTFNANGRYLVDYGSEKEEGKYWVYGQYLHTVEDGAIEKKVRLLSLSENNCLIEMNRAGTLERATLERIN